MSFSDQIKSFTAKAHLNANDASRNIITDIIDEVVFRTPVDTGRARSNWQLGIDKINSTVKLDSFDPEGDATANKLISLIPEYVLGMSIYVANSVPYIHDLENGKSRQAPVGMVAVTQIKFKSFISRANRQNTNSTINKRSVN